MSNPPPPPRRPPSRRPPSLPKPPLTAVKGAGGSSRSGAAERPPLVLAVVVGAAVACAFVLLRHTGPAANLSGFLVGAVAGPSLLIGFLVINSARKSGQKFGDWRWLPSSPTMAAVGLAGWAAGAAHVWFYATEVTRWLVG